MRVTATTGAPADTSADTLVVGVFDGEGIAHDVERGALGALVEAGEARSAFKHVAVAHAAERRWLVIGLGARDRFDAERARVAAAVAHARAGELRARSLCWELPHHVGDEVAAGLVEGTVLGAYRFDRYRAAAEDGDAAEVGELVVSAHHDVRGPVEEAALVAEAQNRARDLGNTPSNDLPPAALARYAEEVAGRHGLRLRPEGDARGQRNHRRELEGGQRGAGRAVPTVRRPPVQRAARRRRGG